MMEMKKLEGNEKNFSIRSVNHPYLIEYPVKEDGMFYDSGPGIVDICGKLQVFDQMSWRSRHQPDGCRHVHHL